jgi:hypothetical protein
MARQLAFCVEYEPLPLSSLTESARTPFHEESTAGRSDKGDPARSAHSALNVNKGSTAAARHAGTRLASNAAIPNNKVTAT